MDEQNFLMGSDPLDAITRTAKGLEKGKQSQTFLKYTKVGNSKMSSKHIIMIKKKHSFRQNRSECRGWSVTKDSTSLYQNQGGKASGNKYTSNHKQQSRRNGTKWEIQRCIESNVEKMMQEAINNIFDYTLESEIRKALSELVNQSFKKIDFTSYNGFILQAVNNAIDGIAKKDFQEKLTEQLSTIFFQKREKVKLSELFERYQEYIVAETSNEEKDRLGKFYAKMKHRDEYGWIEISLGRKTEEYDITISIDNSGGKEGDILAAYDQMMGRDICDSLPIKYPNLFEVYLMNLCYNNTPIEIDVENINEIDTSFLPF